MSENELKRLQELKELIEKYDYQYYELGESEITDAEYDRLYLEYSQLEAKHQEFAVEDSPTKKVGAGNKSGTSTGLAKLPHKSPLLSINTKGKTLESLHKFYLDCGGDSTQFIVEPKLDGITVNINYEGGKFVNAATRGDGYTGELVSANFLETSTKYPSELPNSASLELRGEAIIPLDFFNNRMKNDGYKNPRNASSGLMRTLEKNELLQGVKVMFYDFGQTKNIGISEDDYQNIHLMKNLGFSSIPVFLSNSWDELKHIVETNMNGLVRSIDGFNVLMAIDEKTGDAYPQAVCDGLVIKVNDLRKREELGMTEKGPKWAYAHKFKSLQAETVLRKVEWNTGRSGKLTPVAYFDPVTIGGTTIECATLNNFDFIQNLPLLGETRKSKKTKECKYIEYKKPLDTMEYFNIGDFIVDVENPYCIYQISKLLDNGLRVHKNNESEDIDFKPNQYCLYSEEKGLRLKDTIILERSNDVIPKFIGIKQRDILLEAYYYTGGEYKKEYEKSILKEPERCNVCGGLVKKEGAYHICSNEYCEGKIMNKIIHFTSRDCMNITGLGEATIDMLLALGLIHDVSDIYLLKDKRAELILCDGWKDKSIDNLLNSIETSKQIELWRFIHGLSIPGVGKKAAKDLAEKFASIDDLSRATLLSLQEIEGIGESVGDSVYRFFRDKNSINLIEKLRKYGVSPYVKTNDVDAVFQGKTFVITGTLVQPRKYYQDLIESKGGKVAGSVSKKTDVVLIGEDAGSKETKARELVAKGANILILDSEEKIQNFFK